MPVVLPRQRRRSPTVDAKEAARARNPLRHDMVLVRVPKHGDDHGDAGRGENVRGARDPDYGHCDGRASGAGLGFRVRDHAAGVLAAETALARGGAGPRAAGEDPDSGGEAAYCAVQRGWASRANMNIDGVDLAY